MFLLKKRNKSVLQLVLVFTITLAWMSAKAAIIVGNPNGEVIISEVFDYQCIHCQAMYPVLNELLEDNQAIELKLYPVAIINDDSVVEAAYATSIALSGQGFEEVHNDFMTLSGPDKIASYFKMRPIDEQTNQKMHSKEVSETIGEGYKIMNKVNSHETPLFIIQSKTTHKTAILKGEQSKETLIKTIKLIQGECHDSACKN